MGGQFFYLIYFHYLKCIFKQFVKDLAAAVACVRLVASGPPHQHCLQQESRSVLGNTEQSYCLKSEGVAGPHLPDKCGGKQASVGCDSRHLHRP